MRTIDLRGCECTERQYDGGNKCRERILAPCAIVDCGRYRKHQETTDNSEQKLLREYLLEVILILCKKSERRRRKNKKTTDRQRCDETEEYFIDVSEKTHRLSQRDRKQEPHNRENEADNPVTHHHLLTRPAERFEMVVQRRNEEHFLAIAKLLGQDLNDI